MGMSMSELASKFHKAAKQADSEMSKEFNRFGQVGVGLMKRTIQEVHAVDTGNMLNSVRMEHEGSDTILIGPTMEYSAFVALGTSRMGARPFHTISAKKLAGKVDAFNLNLGV